jgi:hypothetical protein
VQAAKKICSVQDNLVYSKCLTKRLAVVLRAYGPTSSCWDDQIQYQGESMKIDYPAEQAARSRDKRKFLRQNVDALLCT